MSTYTFLPQKLNPDALQQGEIWYDSRGQLHEIDKMPAPYCQNVIRFLFSKCHTMRPANTPLMRALQVRRRQASVEARTF